MPIYEYECKDCNVKFEVFTTSVRSTQAVKCKECKSLNGCETGESKITKAYKLPCKYVIHTVGPIWRGGYNNEDELLSNCYQTSLEVAVKNGINSIAFPNISTGIYRFPKRRAAEIAIFTAKEFLEKHSCIQRLVFAVFDRDNYNIYTELLK